MLQDVVVIVDKNAERRQQISDVLQQAYGRITVVPFEYWEAFKSILMDVTYQRIKLVILSSEIALTYGPVSVWLPSAIDQLMGNSPTIIELVLILLDKNLPDLDRRISPSYPKGRITTEILSGRENKKPAIARVLRQALGNPVDPLPNLTFLSNDKSEPVWSDKPDIVLERQLRCLDPEQNIDGAITMLRMFVRAYWKCKDAAIRRLKQGFSGDLVLRVDPATGTTSSYVLKVVPASRFEGLANEIEHWDDIQNALNHAVKNHVPRLEKPRPEYCNHHLKCIRLGASYAVAFQFLGERIGEFLDLEQVYLLPTKAFPDTLIRGDYGDSSEKAVAKLIEKVLGHLRKAWYGARVDEKKTRAEKKKPLWEHNAGAIAVGEEPVPNFPPYSIPAFWRAEILQGIDYLGQFDGLMEEGGWARDAGVVSRWIQQGPVDGHPLNKKWNIRLTPAHGDLNKSNILLWIDDPQHFFIDFATYQPRGHALQDFAHLEAEIKFLLMDRETSSGLKARDFTPDQLAIWATAENHYASPQWEREFEFSGAAARGVTCAYRMVDKVRQLATDTHRDWAIPDKCPFHVEYFAPLLYHTLRVIGYSGVSPFKRLLAVHSAARIIEHGWKSET